MPTIARFNHTLKKFFNGEVDVGDLYLMLLNAGAAFDPTATNISTFSGNEVDSGGWTTGGEPLANAAVTIVSTDDARLDADDISVLAVGEAIGPARYGVVYEQASGDVLFWLDFEEEKTADESTDFKVIFHADGIMVVEDA